MERMLTTEEVSEITRHPLPTIWKWIRESRLQAVRVGKRYLVKESALHDFLEHGTK